MLQALLSGVASIKTQQTRMNVIGNNLANVNTTAYKGSRVTFKDMLAQTIRGSTRPGASTGGNNPIQFGLGVLISGTDVNNEQGSLNSTNRPTDLAIQGNGFFLVSNGDRIAYSRDGAFDLDANGDLVQRSTGERLLGWTADSATGLINSNAQIGASSSLRIPLGARTAVQVTTDVRWAGNLDAREPENPGPPAYPNPAYRETIVRVFDSLGTQHDVTLRLIKTAPDTWNYSFASTDGSTITGGGDLIFDSSSGSLISGSPAAVTITPPAGGAPAFDVSMDFESMTQLAVDTQVQAANQNGFPPGSLQSFSIGQDGIVTGLYTNGLARPLGQISMAIFPNPNGMERLGNNLWRNTDNSGVPVVGKPITGGRGNINSGFLEQSNVDIGNEFTDMIITQRGFQANTRVVTTVDEMLQELINMKR